MCEAILPFYDFYMKIYSSIRVPEMRVNSQHGLYWIWCVCIVYGTSEFSCVYTAQDQARYDSLDLKCALHVHACVHRTSYTYENDGINQRGNPAFCTPGAQPRVAHSAHHTSSQKRHTSVQHYEFYLVGQIS